MSAPGETCLGDLGRLYIFICLSPKASESEICTCREKLMLTVNEPLEVGTQPNGRRHTPEPKPRRGKITVTKTALLSRAAPKSGWPARPAQRQTGMLPAARVRLFFAIFVLFVKKTHPGRAAGTRYNFGETCRQAIPILPCDGLQIYSGGGGSRMGRAANTADKRPRRCVVAWFGEKRKRVGDFGNKAQRAKTANDGW